MKHVSLRTRQSARAIIKHLSSDQNEVIAFVQEHGYDIDGIVVKFNDAAARQTFANDARTRFGANRISVKELS